MAEGEFALSLKHLTRALPTASWPTEWGSMGGDLDVYALLLEVTAQQGEAPALREYAAHTETLATRHNHALYQGIAHRGWGVAHRLAREYAASETRLQTALQIFETLGARWQLGRTYFELGELALARADPAQARAYFSRALADFDTLRARPDAERTRARLLSLDT